MGREWLNEININWQKLNLADASNNVVPTNSEVERLLKKYVNVFKEGLGVINTFEAQLQVKEGAKPRFCKARPVPFALKEAIDRELDRLEAEGILERVTYSEWAAPVVPVPKTEGQIRLCGDYKVTIKLCRWISIHSQSLITFLLLLLQESSFRRLILPMLTNK